MLVRAQRHRHEHENGRHEHEVLDHHNGEVLVGIDATVFWRESWDGYDGGRFVRSGKDIDLRVSPVMVACDGALPKSHKSLRAGSMRAAQLGAVYPSITLIHSSPQIFIAKLVKIKSDNPRKCDRNA